MATIDSKNLSVLAYANGFTLWHYTTTDTEAEVLTANYFDEISNIVNIGDMVMLNADTDGTPANGMLVITGNASGVVTAETLV